MKCLSCGCLDKHIRADGACISCACPKLVVDWTETEEVEQALSKKAPALVVKIPLDKLKDPDAA